MHGPALVDWLQRLDADTDNVRVAIEWGLESDTEAAIRLCTALWEYWRARSTAAVDAETWFERAVELAATLPPPATGREPERAGPGGPPLRRDGLHGRVAPGPRHAGPR